MQMPIIECFQDSIYNLYGKKSWDWKDIKYYLHSNSLTEYNIIIKKFIYSLKNKLLILAFKNEKYMAKCHAYFMNMLEDELLQFLRLKTEIQTPEQYSRSSRFLFQELTHELDEIYKKLDEKDKAELNKQMSDYEFEGILSNEIKNNESYTAIKRKLYEWWQIKGYILFLEYAIHNSIDYEILINILADYFKFNYEIYFSEVSIKLYNNGEFSINDISAETLQFLQAMSLIDSNYFLDDVYNFNYKFAFNYSKSFAFKEMIDEKFDESFINRVLHHYQISQISIIEWKQQNLSDDDIIKLTKRGVLTKIPSSNNFYYTVQRDKIRTCLMSFTEAQRNELKNLYLMKFKQSINIQIIYDQNKNVYSWQNIYDYNLVDSEIKNDDIPNNKEAEATIPNNTSINQNMICIPRKPLKPDKNTFLADSLTILINTSATIASTILSGRISIGLAVTVWIMFVTNQIQFYIDHQKTRKSIKEFNREFLRLQKIGKSLNNITENMLNRFYSSKVDDTKKRQIGEELNRKVDSFIQDKESIASSYGLALNTIDQHLEVSLLKSPKKKNLPDDSSVKIVVNTLNFLPVGIKDEKKYYNPFVLGEDGRIIQKYFWQNKASSTRSILFTSTSVGLFTVSTILAIVSQIINDRKCDESLGSIDKSSLATAIVAIIIALFALVCSTTEEYMKKGGLTRRYIDLKESTSLLARYNMFSSALYTEQINILNAQQNDDINMDKERINDLIQQNKTSLTSISAPAAKKEKEDKMVLTV